MTTQTLHGSCACGRNRYVVEIPQEQTQLAELRYDNTSASRKSFRIAETELGVVAPTSRHIARLLYRGTHLALLQHLTQE